VKPQPARAWPPNAKATGGVPGPGPAIAAALLPPNLNARPRCRAFTARGNNR